MNTSDEESIVGEHRVGGDYSVPVFMLHRKTTIPPTEAYDILKDADKIPKSQITCVPPQHPRGGEVYIFYSDGKTEREDDFKADAYQWHSGGGGSMLPRKSPIVNRHYDTLIVAKHPKGKDGKGGPESTKEFTRTWYRLVKLNDSNGKFVERKEFTLVHYLGNQTLWCPLPHGNEKNPVYGSDFKRTAPSILQDLKKSEEAPQKVYGTMLAKKDVPPTMKPRDKRQVTNHQQLMRNSLRVSNDEVNNVVLFGLQIKDFVKQVIVDLPNQAIGVYMVSKDLCGMIKRILPLPKVNERAFQVQYDTTFKLGHFYFSMMSFRHPSFTTYPAIPFAFLIHTRKFQDMHHRLFQLVKEECPSLGTAEFVFVTDREFRNVTEVFPKVKHLFCWKHIESDVEVYVRSHRKSGSKDAREPVWYAKKVVELMHSENEAEFERELKAMKSIWSEGFIEYFDKFVKPDILAHANRWLLERVGVYRGGTYGITTNPAEGLNTMVKSLNKFKSTLLMDQVVSSMHFLCKFYDAEEQRGRSGDGNWRNKLCAEHQHYALSPGNIIDDHEFRSPEEIVKFIIESSTEHVVTRNGDEEGGSDRDHTEDPISDESIEQAYETPSFQDAPKKPEKSSAWQTSASLLDEPTKKLDADTTKDAEVKCDSQRMHALNLVRSQKIKRLQLAPDRTVFVCEGSKNAIHAVSLLPRETCTCPATQTCYHILAARLMEGQPLQERRGTLKLSQIIFNARKRHDRKQEKRPRKNDYLDVEPAPDSMLFSASVQGTTSTPKKRKVGETTIHQAPSKRPSPIIEVNELDSVLDGPDISVPPNCIGEKQTEYDEKKDETRQNWKKTCRQKGKKAEKLVSETNPEVKEAQADDVKQKVVEPPDENLDPTMLKKSESRQVESKSGSTEKNEVLNDSGNVLHCVCRKPYSARRKMAFCPKCKVWYHQTCLKIPNEVFVDESIHWECDDCWKSGVLKLGGASFDGTKVVTLSNTCPMDSFFSIVHSYEKGRSDFMSGIIVEGTAEAALKDCVQFFRAGEYDSGKLRWISFIKGKVPVPSTNNQTSVTYNTYGCIDKFILDFFRPIWTIKQLDQCSNRGCSQRERIQHFNSFMLDKSHTDGRCGIFDITKSLCRSTCDKGVPCKGQTTSGRICTGTRTTTEGAFENFRPFMIPIDLDKISAIPEILNLPLGFLFDDLKFTLGGIIVNQPQTHFEIIVPRRGEWFHHDGYSKFARISGKDMEQLGKRLILSKVIYFNSM